MLLAIARPMLLVTALAPLAVGCCCPISGRYDQACPPLACQPSACTTRTSAPFGTAPPESKAVQPPAPIVTPSEKDLAASKAPPPKLAPPTAEGAEDSCGPLLAHRPLLAYWLKGHGGPDAVNLQHADYISPSPRFHPVPTRPVFEPR